jgi:phenylpropionate dioxygenase-like ring-hydroxylating dioxygenase large terminal subunit
MGWQQHWYPVAFVRDLGTGPHAFAIHGRPYVIFRAGDGSLQGLEDRCPHRGARLSDGSVKDGQLECGYHGWSFGTGGRCMRIPQLPPERAIPDRAHAAPLLLVERQGIAWAWPAGDGEADPASIPAIAGLDRAGTQSVDFAIDLPYDQTFLVENVIDIAHIHIAHDGVRGGGLRSMAAPLQFEIEESSAAGLRATFRSVGVAPPDAGELHGASVEFRAPNLVHYESHYADAQRVAGLALYSLPIGPQRCRLIYRAYGNSRRFRDRLRPRWLEHWTQCKILEQDMAVVVGQAAYLNAAERPPRELWLPLQTSDALVIEYRKWIDAHAADWPCAIGFARTRPARERADVFDRYTMHTRICSSCSRALRFVHGLQAPLVVATVALLAIAACLAGTTASAVAGGLAVAAAIGALVAHRIEARFR